MPRKLPGTALSLLATEALALMYCFLASAELLLCILLFLLAKLFLGVPRPGRAIGAQCAACRSGMSLPVFLKA